MYDLDSGPDPATVATATPEPTDSSNRLYAVGIGPGDLEYLTPRGERAIREADVVVGFETVVEYVAERTDADLLTCGYRDEAEALSRFADRVADGDTGTAVLMGDPNHSGYQFVGKVQAVVDASVRVIPGISSLQVAASRARTPMEETTFVTLHKSGDIAPDLRRLRADVGERHLLVLPRPYDWMPEDVAADLIEAGAPASLDALVMERLTHDDETETRTTLGELATDAGGSSIDETAFSDLSVLAVRTGEQPTNSESETSRPR
ncbi:precorrin-6Y C5,15-methyltransferase (decarboxylating) [Halogranum amylolyticum]|uniref:Precorrin-6Y C5,15-methyltransferase (Decarboxylating) n=1 Tax=Halogranum amylolyticum TaxID=660520 RepID=A0A1H8VSC2_9EURY|nr:cobalt-precorrin-7 (C(5))-methyltransferase [Halogranum amylolyticum]SEP18127.1 precorrin-6Y C5,15-methyltransferase (decarboxylating) [Halogranum amylolyticum]